VEAGAQGRILETGAGTAREIERRIEIVEQQIRTMAQDIGNLRQDVGRLQGLFERAYESERLTRSSAQARERRPAYGDEPKS